MSSPIPKKPDQETLDYIREFLSYDPETGLITWKKRPANRIQKGQRAGGISGGGYESIRIKGRKIKTHHIAWFLYKNEWPDKSIDHINRVKTDNKISNLRLVSHSQNLANRGLLKNSSTKLTGVGFHKPSGLYQSRIALNKKRIPLGYFNSAKEAAQAYNNFVIQQNLEEFYPLNEITPNPQ